MYKIYIFCTRENYFHPAMFYKILKRYSESIVGVGIFPYTKSQKIYNRIKRIIEVDGATALLYIFIHRIKYMLNCLFRMNNSFFRVESVFKKFNIPIDYFNDPNDIKCIERIKALGVDAIFNNQPKTLKKDILKAPKIICLNKHTSKLPYYRGIEPVFYALLYGELEIGVSIHGMTEDIDSGDVYAQLTVPADNSVFNCYKKTFDLGAELFGQAIRNLERKTPLLSIKGRDGTYFKYPSKEDIFKFKARNLKYYGF